MMNKRLFPVSLSIVGLAFIVGFWVGCTVGFDANESGIYPCETKADCLENFECLNNYCMQPTANNDVPPCVDEDEDGYGAPGTDRRGCAHPEPDCDDTNRDVNPGAPEVCDGIDNNCDGNTDIIPCTSNGDCPINQADPQGNAVSYRCESDACVAYPVNSVCFAPKPACPECAQPLQCSGGILATVPEACR